MSEVIEFHEELIVPAKRVLCTQCNGDGTSSAYLGDFTWTEMNEQGEDFVEDYFAGRLDKQCETCKGKRWELIPDEDRMTKEQVAEVKDFYDQAYYDRQVYKAEMGIY
jgi:predicted methyltransferase